MKNFNLGSGRLVTISSGRLVHGSYVHKISQVTSRPGKAPSVEPFTGKDLERDMRRRVASFA